MRAFLKLVVVCILVMASVAQAGERAKSFTFDNGAKIEVKKIASFLKIQKLPLENAEFRPSGGGKAVPLGMSPLEPISIVLEDSDRERPTETLLAYGSKTRLINSSGQTFELAVDAKTIQSWRGTTFQSGNQKYFAASYLKTNGAIETTITRLGDGKTLFNVARYFDFKSMTVTANGEVTLAAGEPTIDLRNFDTLVSAEDARRKTPVDDAKASRLRGQVDVENIVIEHLQRKVFGQENLLRRMAKYYVTPPYRGKPTVLVLTGPSGVGKTYLATNFATEIFSDPKYFLEIDGTEHGAPESQGNIEIHKIVGAPLGQFGGQKGELTEWMARNNGDGVLLINEADKMHPDTWKRLMELFDRGVIKSGGGRTYRSNKLYIILTSNRGATQMFPPTVASWSQKEIDARMQTLDSKTIRGYYMQKSSEKDRFDLPREIINRVTEFLAAAPISQEAAVLIAADTARSFNRRAREEFGVTLRLTPEVIRHLALTGFASTDDGRQIRNQVNEYMAEALKQAGKAWPLKDDSVVDVRLNKNSRNVTELAVSWTESNEQVHELIVEAPQTKSHNPIEDDATVERIERLAPILNERIIGQSAAVNSVVEAVTTQLGDAARRRPISLFLIGSTGTGKTEMGRAVAEALFDSPERLSVISLGNVQNEANFNKVFGSDPGYQGADTVREFEQALQNNPQGGVIVFDEASNMGGGNKDTKAALFKKFYEMTEEGKWTSPVNNKTYNLEKYVFLFTGNDGEELFQGVTAEDMRMTIWKNNSSAERVREILIESGLPEAFLNRMADIALMKPLTRQEMDRVVVKLLNDRIKAFTNQYRGIKITYSPQFVKQIADSFFLSERGGRSIRTILDDRMPALLTNAIIKSGIDRHNFEGVELKLSLEDNLSTKPYLRKGAAKRLVTMGLEILSQGRSVHKRTMDLTRFATTKRFLKARGALSTSYHEMGHAVVNDPSVTMEEMTFISIEGGKHKDIEFLGYARYEPIDGEHTNPTRRSTIMRIGQLYAGVAAQEMAGFEADAGFHNDLSKIRKHATDYLIKWSNDPALIGLRVDKDGEPIMNERQQKVFDEKLQELMVEGRLFAEQKLLANWSLVRTGVAELLQRGNINKARFEQLQAAVSGRTTTPRQEATRDQARTRMFATPGLRCESIFK